MAKTKAKTSNKRKIYVIDTNVFISDPDCLNMFDDNEIVIPDTVIEELDDNKKTPGDKGYNTRQALRNFWKMNSCVSPITQPADHFLERCVMVTL